MRQSLLCQTKGAKISALLHLLRLARWFWTERPVNFKLRHYRNSRRLERIGPLPYNFGCSADSHRPRTDKRMQKIYLAGPEVFLPEAIEVGRQKKELCARYGFEGLFPFDNEIDPKAAGEDADRLIYRANERMIRRADIGICNLTPFRGVHADAGTVFELGMLVGLGKRVFGYTNVADDLLARCKSLDDRVTYDPARDIWRDSNAMTIENFGNADNLMIDNALIERGSHKIVRHVAQPGRIFQDLTGFEMCLRLAAEAASKSA
jgi:nucleoside 2-deoxyribosyltransferase